MRWIWIGLLLLGGGWLSAEELRLETDFPGGSGEMQGIDQEKRILRVIPTQHKQKGWNCWWYFKLSGISPGETVTIDLAEGHSGSWSRPQRAAFSLDGKTWQQTAPGERVADRIIYRQQIDAESAYFAWGPPFVLSDAKRLVEELAEDCEHATAYTLCKSLQGHPVPALKIKQPGAEEAERLGIWINARQHAWESGGSWVGTGLAKWLTSADPRAEALRKRAVIHLVPLMDVDSVQIGAGGKNQHPHDHNRDWSDDPHYHSTAAAMEWIRARDEQGRFDLYVDLHNPGSGAREPFYMVPNIKTLSQTQQRNLEAFFAASKAEITGKLRFTGRFQETGPRYDPKRWKYMSSTWACTNLKPHVIGLTLETAWNTPHSTQAGYQTVGKQLGMAIERYSREPLRTLE